MLPNPIFKVYITKTRFACQPKRTRLNYVLIFRVTLKPCSFTNTINRLMPRIGKYLSVN